MVLYYPSSSPATLQGVIKTNGRKSGRMSGVYARSLHISLQTLFKFFPACVIYYGQTNAVILVLSLPL